MSLLNNAGLSKRAQIENWLKEMNIRNYLINQDMTIDVYGNVDINNKNLTQFPLYINFNKIAGHFRCAHNKIESLRGGPKEIFGVFDCSYNQLKSLEHGPEIVLSTYYCGFNKLKTLKGSPSIAFGRFDCSYNLLYSLKYCPKIFHNGLDCAFNKITRLHLRSKKIIGILDCSGNYLEYINDCPKKMNGCFYIKDNCREFAKSDVLKCCKIDPKFIIC